MTALGRSVLRLEDRPLLTGRGRFIGDISLTGEVHMRVVRSPVAHGRIIEIDTEDALQHPGMVAIWTGTDVSDMPPIDFRQEGLTDLFPYRQPILAQDVVRYVGEPVAVVFARDAYVAEDIAESIFVDIEELPVLTSSLDEPQPFDVDHLSEAAIVEVSYGDLDAAFASADQIVDLEVAVGRHTGIPMETRGALAVVENDGRLVMYGAAKVPHYNRMALARMLDIEADRVVLREGHVGGGFGVRGELYPEDVLACLAALKLNVPVKWIEDRKEHLIATNHSRDQVHRMSAAVDADGSVTGVRVEFWLDQGAYIRTHAATVPNLTMAMFPGPYRFPAYGVKGHIRLTNKTPAGTYRAPGRYESTFARERLMDEVARVLELDRLDVRRRNMIRKDEMPFARPIRALGTELEYDSGDYEGLLDTLVERLEKEGVYRLIESRRAAGELMGCGVAFFVEKSGLGPYEGTKLEVDEQGHVTVITGAASVGQGVETTIAQVCAEELSIPYENVTVIHGQTDAIPYGLGAFASRLSVMAGTATHMAASAVRTKALDVAALLLEADTEDLRLSDGAVEVIGAPERRVSLGEIAQRLDPSGAAALGMDTSLAAESWFKTDHMTYPYGAHAAIVAIDAGTGDVKVERFFVAYDIGRAINPMLVEGQIVGGAAQGLGGALLEEFVYSDDGQPLATSFMDYLLPTSTEMPPVDVILLEDAPSPLNPLGVKGAGEGGTTAFGAAVAAAVDDALGMPGAITKLPIVPESLLKIIKSTERKDPE